MGDMIVKDNFNGLAENRPKMGNAFGLFNNNSNDPVVELKEEIRVQQERVKALNASVKNLSPCHEMFNTQNKLCANKCHQLDISKFDTANVNGTDRSNADAINQLEKQSFWVELHNCIRFVYKNALSSVTCTETEIEIPDKIKISIEDLVKRLCEEDSQQLFIRLEVLIRDFVLEARDQLRELQNVDNLPVQYLKGLLASYGAFCSAAGKLAPFLPQLDLLLMKRFSVNFELLNKYLFQACFYSDSFVQNNVPLYISQLRTTDSSQQIQYTNQELIHSYLAFDDEMTDIASRWLDVKKMILRFSKKRALSNTKGPLLLEDWEVYREHRELAANRAWQTRTVKREMGEFDVQLLSLLDDITSRMPELEIGSNVKNGLGRCKGCNMDILCTCDDCTIKHILTCGLDTPPVSPTDKDSGSELIESLNHSHLLKQFSIASKMCNSVVDMSVKNSPNCILPNPQNSIIQPNSNTHPSRLYPVVSGHYANQNGKIKTNSDSKKTDQTQTQGNVKSPKITMPANFLKLITDKVITSTLVKRPEDVNQPTKCDNAVSGKVTPVTASKNTATLSATSKVPVSAATSSVNQTSAHIQGNVSSVKSSSRKESSADNKKDDYIHFEKSIGRSLRSTPCDCESVDCQHVKDSVVKPKKMFRYTKITSSTISLCLCGVKNCGHITRKMAKCGKRESMSTVCLCDKPNCDHVQLKNSSESEPLPQKKVKSDNMMTPSKIQKSDKTPLAQKILKTLNEEVSQKTVKATCEQLTQKKISEISVCPCDLSKCDVSSKKSSICSCRDEKFKEIAKQLKKETDKLTTASRTQDIVDTASKINKLTLSKHSKDCAEHDNTKKEVLHCRDQNCTEHTSTKNNKESRRCDCPHCEVFESTNSQVNGKFNKTRDRLRTRLNEKRSKALKENTSPKTKCAQELALKPKIKGPENQSLDSNTITPDVDTRDIKELIDFIEGTDKNQKLINAQKKAAKKARRREKKLEEERQKEEERLLEERRIEDERKRIEEEKAARLREQEAKLKEQELKLREQSTKSRKAKNQNANKQNKNSKNSNDIKNIISHTQDRDNNILAKIGPMVTIKRVIEPSSSEPTVTITLKGSTPDKDKLLYTLVNGQSEATKPDKTIISEISKKQKKKAKKEAQIITDMVLENLPKTISKKEMKKKQKEVNKQIKAAKSAALIESSTNTHKIVAEEEKKSVTSVNQNKSDNNLNLEMLRLPPGITITKVEGPAVTRKLPVHMKPATTLTATSSTIQSSDNRSGVIVVDTVKLKQDLPAPEQPMSQRSKKNKKKKNKKGDISNNTSTVTSAQCAYKIPTGVASVSSNNTNTGSVVTIKNPMFYQLQEAVNNKVQGKAKIVEPPKNENTRPQQASIIKGANGMVTIRSPRLNGVSATVNGSDSLLPIHTVGAPVLPELKPLIGPNLPTYKPVTTESNKPFNAQEILSGLPGIEITKINKDTIRNKTDCKKAYQPADVSIIPTNMSNGTSGDTYKLFYDNSDWSLESVFAPKDIKEDEVLDAEELELEAFKRFCQQSVPPERKEKVAYLNVKDIVLKKKASNNGVNS